MQVVVRWWELRPGKVVSFEVTFEGAKWWIYNVQHSQAKLEPETRAVASWGRLGDEGIKIKWFWVAFECTDGGSLSDGIAHARRRVTESALTDWDWHEAQLREVDYCITMSEKVGMERLVHKDK